MLAISRNWQFIQIWNILESDDLSFRRLKQKFFFLPSSAGQCGAFTSSGRLSFKQTPTSGRVGRSYCSDWQYRTFGLFELYCWTRRKLDRCRERSGGVVFSPGKGSMAGTDDRREPPFIDSEVEWPWPASVEHIGFTNHTGCSLLALAPPHPNLEFSDKKWSTPQISPQIVNCIAIDLLCPRQVGRSNGLTRCIGALE